MMDLPRIAGFMAGGMMCVLAVMIIFEFSFSVNGFILSSFFLAFGTGLIVTGGIITEEWKMNVRNAEFNRNLKNNGS